MSNATADFGKYVEAIDNSYLTIQYNVKDLHNNKLGISVTA